jgi:hypothetical protein
MDIWPAQGEGCMPRVALVLPVAEAFNMGRGLLPMNCPHCLKPIPPDLILRERQSELAKRKRGKHTRPGAKGLIRNPAGRPKKSV